VNDAGARVDPGTGEPDPFAANLDKIERIVVLMMENRSFDHMLGYLTQAGMPEVEGLTQEHGNPLADGTFEPVRPMAGRAFDVKAVDPGHGHKDVEVQLRDRNQGFVGNFVDCYARHNGKYPPPPGFEFDPTLVLGYQEAKDVPVYDWIARNHVVCDHWFSSVPGPTWENRLFATTGGLADQAPPKLPGGVLAEQMKNLPIYEGKAFTRWLDGDDWRWYSHDPASLRLIDSRYRPGGEGDDYSDANFAYFNRETLFERRTFLDDAREGKLRPVSWIDPNFVDFRLFGPPGSNDDHPPSNVMLGQELVLTVVTALMRSKQWDDTLLVVTYDEHGGIYDHVVPGDFEVPGDEGASYGVRVPALAISPWADQHVCKTVFDHTSLLKTILLKFANDPAAALKASGSRTRRARHLGELLNASSPRRPATDAELAPAFERVTEWKRAAYERQLLEVPTAGERTFEAVSDLDKLDTLTDLQKEIVGTASALRALGLTPGQP